ncbi:MAG: NYN domain-containing protein [Simkaniaceae bacterium]|nr:NYN domain-containing protein [Simkaniaceae bacterium]
MQFLIDGYNLLFRRPERSQSLSESRRELIAYLINKLSTRNFKSAIVFDSNHELANINPTRYDKPPIEIIYAPEEKSADCYIIELIQIHKNPKSITLVTSDRGLAMRAKEYGAKTMEVESFMKMIEKTSPKSEKRDYQESPQRISQLEEIFEKRLKEKPPSDDKFTF